MMFWKYTRFESKLTLNNRKNWVIALFFLVIFMLLFLYTAKENAPESLFDQKEAEADDMQELFNYMDAVRYADDDTSEVYDLIAEEASLVNMQRWYIGSGDQPDEFIEDGLELNELRMKVHEMGNLGMPDHYIIPKHEILQETALLKYIKKHDLPIESESFMTSYFMEKGMQTMSGILFFVVVLIAGSEMLTFEQRHESVFNGFPISFMQKVASKVLIQSMFIYVLFVSGLLIGITYLKSTLEAFDFGFPIMIYSSGDYVAVSVFQYVIYMFIAFLLIGIITLLGAIICNMLFKHAFATILAGLGVFIIPYLITLAGWKAPILSAISYLDFASVLAGDNATNLQYASMDFMHGYIWLSIVIVLLVGVIYIIHKSFYINRDSNETKKTA